MSAEKTEFVIKLCGRDSIQITPAGEGEVLLENLAERLKKVGEVKLSPLHLAFLSEGFVITVFKDGRAIVKGTDDETLAKSLYSKYIGN
jgi:adenylyltransferase/sulfurtransferase